MRRQIFKHKESGWGSSGPAPYISPFLLEILSTRPGAPTWPSATGSLVANTGQAVSCVRASSAYCMGDDGLLHLLGPNTVRVEPTGLLTEIARNNYIFPSDLASITNFAGDATPSCYPSTSQVVPTVNSTDVLDPMGTNTAAKLVFPARADTALAWFIALTGAGGNARVSIYIRGAAGQGNQTIYLARTDEGVNGSVAFTVGETWTRISAKCSGYMVVGYGNDSGDSQPSLADATFYVWGPQVEQVSPFTSGTFPTSYIPTDAGGIASRDTDQVRLLGGNPLAGLSQPVPSFTCGAHATPNAPWVSMGLFSNCFLVNVSGNNAWGTAGNWALNFNLGVGQKVAITGWGTGNAQHQANSSKPTSTTSQDTWIGFGQITTVPSCSITDQSSETGTGDNDITQNTTVWLGQLAGSNAFSGHMTDISINVP